MIALDEARRLAATAGSFFGKSMALLSSIHALVEAGDLERSARLAVELQRSLSGTPLSATAGWGVCVASWGACMPAIAERPSSRSGPYSLVTTPSS